VFWHDPDWNTEQLPTLRAQFERYYNAAKAQGDAIQGSERAAELMPRALRSLDEHGDGPRRLMGGDA
jgi:hypothetical protein